MVVPDKKIDIYYSKFDEIDQIDKDILDKIKHFFEHYKELEKDKFVKVINWENKYQSEKIIRDSIKRFAEEHNKS